MQDGRRRYNVISPGFCEARGEEEGEEEGGMEECRGGQLLMRGKNDGLIQQYLLHDVVEEECCMRMVAFMEERTYVRSHR